ncbi:hypothetical protein [Arthrobacter pityocampae]|uniref:hypothetical protein n=1 Tax=Arthrobacter pityocampae TaxID=547334 RepID=UPI003736D67D
MVRPPRGAAAVGSVVVNEGDETLILEDISLVGANNLELLDGYIFPIDGDNGFVLGAGSTEPEDPQERAAWATAQQPGLFELSPGAAANAVVAVDKTTDAQGTAEAIRVTYSIDGQQYTADTTMTIELAATTCF